MHPIGISADRDHGKTDAVVIGFVQYLFQIVPGNKFFEFGKLILPQFNSEWTIRCRLGFRVRPHVVIQRFVDIHSRTATIYVFENIIQTIGINHLAIDSFDMVLFDNVRAEQFRRTGQQRIDLFGEFQLFSR